MSNGALRRGERISAHIYLHAAHPGHEFEFQWLRVHLVEACSPSVPRMSQWCYVGHLRAARPRLALLAMGAHMMLPPLFLDLFARLVHTARAAFEDH